MNKEIKKQLIVITLIVTVLASIAMPNLSNLNSILKEKRLIRFNNVSNKELTRIIAKNLNQTIIYYEDSILEFDFNNENYTAKIIGLKEEIEKPELIIDKIDKVIYKGNSYVVSKFIDTDTFQNLNNKVFFNWDLFFNEQLNRIIKNNLN